MKKNIYPNTWKNPKTHYLRVLNENWYKILIKLENLITVETIKFYEKNNLTTMHLPVTTGSISSPMGKGSDSIPVKVKLDGIDTYLADSMQFLLEYGCRICEKGVYYIMPTFRGEQPDKRHLCQFYHSEAEIIGNLNDVMSLVEKYIKHLSKAIIKKYGDELKKYIGDISHIEYVANYQGHFPKITFEEAYNQLYSIHKNNINKYIKNEIDCRNITSEGEKELMKLNGGIVWVTNYDYYAVPFYQKEDPVYKGTTKNADLLMGIGETVGCGERHDNYKDLLNSIKKHKINKKDYNWYITMKKKKPLNTSGFGMGIERFLMWVLKCDDIRNMQICLRFNGKNIFP